MGLGVCRGIQNVTGIPCAIKWPNDILVGTKKIAGILTEMTLEGETIQSAVVGIGINVQTQQFPPELETIATSVYAETGEKHKRARLIQEILLQIERIYDEYMALGNCDSLLTQYKACCMTLSKTVRVIYKKEEREGVATDISAMGGLIVETASGETLHVHAGEVSIREA